MTSRVVYLDPITAVERTEFARIIKVDPEVVVLRNTRTGWKYTRPIDLIVSIDGKPTD